MSIKLEQDYSVLIENIPKNINWLANICHLILESIDGSEYQPKRSW